MRPTKLRKAIRSADGFNRRRQNVAPRTELTGNLTTPLYPTQAKNLLEWSGLLVGTPAIDTPSYTIDFFDSIRTRRYLGVKVEQAGIASTADSDYATLALTLRGQKPDTTNPTLAQPASTVFPTEVPYEHVETKGLITLAATPLTKYSEFSATIRNTLAPTWDEDVFITALYWCGRDVDFTIRNQYVDSTWRNAYEAQTPLTITAKFNRVSPAKSLTLDFQTNTTVADLTEDLPLDGAGYLDTNYESFFDGTTGTDLVLTFT